MCSKTQWAGPVGRHDLARSRGPSSVSATSSPGCTSRISSAPMMSNARALGGDAEAVAELAERQRAYPVRVAERDHGALGHHHGRVGALEARHHRGDGVLDRPGLVDGEQRGDDLRVGGAAERDPALAQLVVELDRVGQVAVVGERHLAPVVAPDRLRVLPRAAAGRRVADVADRHVAVERAQLLLVEDLGDEPGVAQGRDVPALAAGDAGRLLAAVLERVEREVGEPGHVVAGGVDPEHPALVARTVAIGNVIVVTAPGAARVRS